MDGTMLDSLLAPFFSIVIFNVFLAFSLIACKKKASKEPTAPSLAPAAPAGDAKVEEEKEKSTKEQSKKESSKKNSLIKSAKKSVKEQKSKKESSKKEKKKSAKKLKEDEKPVSPDGDDDDKEREPEKAEEKKEGKESGDKKDEEKKPEENEPEKKKEEEKKDGEAAPPATSPAAQTAMQLLKNVALEPAELRFTQNGGTSKLMVANNTGSRIAVKIKCSDNTLFRVNPVFSFIEKDGKCAIEVSRTTGNPKPDKIAVLTTEVADDVVDAQAIFKETPTEKQATISVPMHVN